MKKISLILILITSNLFLHASIARAEEYSSSEEVRLVILSRGNGSGMVMSSGRKTINCSSCDLYFKKDEIITLKAVAQEGSVFRGWSNTFDLAQNDSSFTEEEVLVSLKEPKRIYAKFDLIRMPSVPQAQFEDLEVPRVMFWWGKVNQHWEFEEKAWATDSDGTSGARENKLDYCKKFYPNTTRVVPYKKEMINSWHDAGNTGQYLDTRISYRCVQGNERISGPDVSNLPEKPDGGSICSYYPDLPLCRPLEESKDSDIQDLHERKRTGADFPNPEELWIDTSPQSGEDWNTK